VELSHEDCLTLLADRSTQNFLEKLGYEYSPAGLSLYRRNRPDIMPALVKAVVAELERDPIFPPEYRGSIPQFGLFIRGEGRDFTVMDIDKPSAWGKEIFSTSEGAARRYIRKRCDKYWFDSDPSHDEQPKSVQSS
jgi:hypothetical protein